MSAPLSIFLNALHAILQPKQALCFQYFDQNKRLTVLEHTLTK
jgi:hypothetical protein